MDYQAAYTKLLGLVDLERMRSATRFRKRYNLAKMEAILDRMGNPQSRTPALHITGTKGKGSTAALCSSVLVSAGYHTGFYSSPHIHTFRERIRLDGEPVSPDEFASLVERVWPDITWVTEQAALGGATMFEALTAMAFLHFSERADVQVLEVGLGGRLDTTNVIQPPALKACAITSISLDHTSILGDSLESIANEKAGIIKPGTTVVSAPQHPEAMGVIRSVADEKEAELVVVGKDVRWTPGSKGQGGQSFTVHGRSGSYDLWTPLLGDFQMENGAVAVGVLEAAAERGLEITEEAMKEGFRTVSWPCRMEVLPGSPRIVCDGSHNPYSAAKLKATLPEYLDYSHVIMVAGVSADKNMGGIVAELAGMTKTAVVARSRHPRAADAEEVAEAFRTNGTEAVVAPDVGQALEQARAMAGDDDIVLATGSLFIAAEVREAVLGIEPELYT